MVFLQAKQKTSLRLIHVLLLLWKYWSNSFLNHKNVKCRAQLFSHRLVYLHFYVQKTSGTRNCIPLKEMRLLSNFENCVASRARKKFFFLFLKNKFSSEMSAAPSTANFVFRFVFSFRTFGVICSTFFWRENLSPPK